MGQVMWQLIKTFRPKNTRMVDGYFLMPRQLIIYADSAGVVGNCKDCNNMFRIINHHLLCD